MFIVALMNLILASQSPRRLYLLASAGFDVVVRPSHIDESALPGESTEAMTLRLCREKALACDTSGYASLPVVAADTLVSVDGEALGQPRDLAHAREMIWKLSGKVHQVYTAVCVCLGGHCETALVTTSVQFRHVSEEEIEIYLQHNDILDKAGSYAIQGGASSFITAIEGPLDNVIGLPVQQTMLLLEKLKNNNAGNHDLDCLGGVVQ